MFRRIAAAVIVVGLIAPLGPLLADGFIPGVKDLPLMDGLEEIEGTSLIFDSPMGRVVKFSAASSHSREDVLFYYSNTLPALGWKLMAVTSSGAAFVREGEDLIISFGTTTQDGRPSVKFELSPDTGN